DGTSDAPRLVRNGLDKWSPSRVDDVDSTGSRPGETVARGIGDGECARLSRLGRPREGPARVGRVRRELRVIPGREAEEIGRERRDRVSVPVVGGDLDVGCHANG